MRKVQKSEIDEMCEAHKLCSGSAPVSVPRITCNCGKTWAERMVGGTGSGNRAGKIPPTVGIDSFNLGGRGAPKDEIAFLATSGANFCGYGSGAEFAGSETFAQRPEGSPPRGAAALARSLHEWVLEEGRARTREEECLRRPPTWRAKDVGGNCPPRAPMGPEPLCLSGERVEGAQRADCSEHAGGLPRFGPRWTRKTLLLLSLYSVGELGSFEN